MNRFLVSIVFLVLVYSQVNLRLNTKQTTRLQVDNSITSTLGLFKATLRKNNCSLQILTFNDPAYVSKGFYFSPNITKDCSYLEIKQGQLVSSQNQTFMYVGDSFNQSTIFTIDDLGVIRLIGTYIKLNRVTQQSFQTSITNFYTAQKYIYAGTKLNVKFNSPFDPLVNQRGWTYFATFGQLDIFYDQNQNMTKSYVYSSFKFNNSQIQDFNSATFPAAIFSNITFEPRCFDPRIYLDFKAPFIIMADPYWPKVTVMQQGGYKIFQFTYSKISQFSSQPEERDINYIRQFSFCPDQTFQHKGKCLTKCPAPYFHQMKGKAGSCRLVCEQFTPVDTANRICTCMSTYQSVKYNSEFIKSCPNDTQKYPYGCYCKNAGRYFDKKFTFSCVSTCPSGTFAHEGGLCVSCPANCITCGIDNFSRLQLQCKACQSGYILNDGQCIKKCNSNFGNSLMSDGSCIQCTDQNCMDCSSDKNVCKKCNLLFTLNNGTCLQSCPTNTTLVPAQFFDSKCLPNKDAQCLAYLTSHYKDKAYLKCDQCKNSKVSHLDGCVTTCPTNYKKFDYQGYSYCSCVSGVTIDNQCLNISGCPIKMSYDAFSDSCLSCSFGCVTCRGSICTSCYPGYFLYVSPQAIICRRKSPLFACDDQYGLANGICLVKDYENLQMTQCRANIPNCKVCPFQSDYRTSLCVTCQDGFYLYLNACLKECPKGFITYQNSVCVLTQINNCQMPHLISKRQSSILNITYIEKNKPYNYYISAGIQPANDPVGYIPYFQKLTSSRRVTDGLFRQNIFFQPQWTCLKCTPGYGLSPDFKSCAPCIDPCLTCYMALNTSCLTTKQTNVDPVNPPPPNGCNGYIDYASKQCIKSCNSTNSYPQLENNILYCKTALLSQVSDFVRIDSAIYVQDDNTKLAYFVFDNQIPKDTSVTVKIKNSTSSTSRLLQQQNYRLQTVKVQNGRYFQVQSGIDQNVIIADFTNSIYSLKSVEGYYPPNLIYGSAAQNTHPQFMKTWLSIIGQIMSMVIVAMHCIYVGNELLYKMDNLMILVQTIYYFSFVKILAGRLLAQFYYGWIFSHLGFFPNFFPTPNQYRENDAPISFKLATTDANFIRNAGYSISIFIVFIGAWALVTGIAYLVYKKFHKKQIWYPNIAKSSLFAGIQLFSMNIMFWAIAHFLYRGGCQNCDEPYNKQSLAWAIIFTALIWIYTIARSLFDPIAGLYMAKRLLIATILAAAFDNLAFIAPLVILEVVFVAARYIIQRPQLKKQKLLILAEFGIMLLCYLLLFICTNAGVNTIIISVAIFIFIVALMSDLMQVYLESINEWQLQDDNKHSQVKSGLQRAHTDQDQVVGGSQIRQIQSAQ